MKTSRRTFLELSGATAGVAAFAGGSDSALAVSSDPTVASLQHRTHPSPRGVSYITTRLAASIFDAVMAM